jgi:RNA polymerase sigma factor (sigma-70 family)
MMDGLTKDERALCAGYARAAGAIARSVAHGWNVVHLADDLRGIAFVALSKAGKTFDPARRNTRGKPTKFETYAWRKVTSAVMDAARREWRRISLEVVLDLAEDLADQGETRDADEAMDQIDAATADVMDAFALACAGVEMPRGAEAELMRAETRADLERALSALKPEHRRQFELRHRDGLRWSVIEEQLGVPERTLKDRDGRIGAALRAALRGRGG